MTGTMTQTAARATPPAAELARMLATLAWVVATAAIVLAALGAVPGRITGDAHGVRRAATVEEAERRVRSSLFLPAFFPDRLAWPPSEVRVAGGRGGSVRLVFAPRGPKGAPVTLLQSTTAGEEIDPDLVGERRVLAEARTTIGSHPAGIATVLVDGATLAELSWQLDGRALVLRGAGDLDELYRMAHSARREGR
jgi:hypothetical protein